MDNSVGGILGSAMDSIMKTMGDNCTIGNPIEMQNGTVIIPVSKISVGFGGGGSDFGAKGKDNKYFGGGGGTGITATPVGFLVVTGDGKVTFTSTNAPAVDGNAMSIDKIINSVSEVVEKIKTKIPKKNTEKKPEKSEEPEETKENKDDK